MAYRGFEAERINALDRSRIDEPSTYGARFPQATNLSRKFPEFITHTVPDISPTTRILAVCGPNDKDGKADPQEDGWFFSDFYLFHHLFRGLGISQQWVTSEEPSYLVGKYGEYLHGNPYKPRKVVLDQKIIREGNLGPITVVPRGTMKTQFLNMVKAECRTARANSESVLIMLFGHGDEHNYGVTVGTGALAKLKISNICSAVGTHDLRVSLLSTACYSGGWSVSPELNMTTMTAAGPSSQSSSWNASASLGRMCGSIWASAIVPVLLEETTFAQASAAPKSLDDVLPEDATEHQQKTFSSFCHSIFERLYKRTDRKATEHDITFSAQDDDWECFWARRTGFPLADYQKRFDKLRELPISYLDHPELNRVVEMPRLLEGRKSGLESARLLEQYEQHQRWSLELPRHGYGSGKADKNVPPTEKSTSDVPAKRSYSGAFGQSIRSLRNAVAQMAEDYLNSFPGEDNAGPNTAVHGKARRCIKGEISDEAQLIALSHWLEYRTGLMSLADAFVKHSSSLPKGQSCAEWDPRSTSSLGKEFGFARKDYDRVRGMVYRKGLFPRPTESQGESWPKPADFLAVALLCAKLDGKQIERKLDDLGILAQKIKIELSSELMQEPIIRTKRRKVMDALSTAIRSISPVRKQRKSYDDSSVNANPAGTNRAMGPPALGSGKIRKSMDL